LSLAGSDLRHLFLERAMDLNALYHSGLFKWAILPVLIFLARILDVTIGTIRILFVSRGHKLWAPILGFFEVVVWLLAIGQIMQNLTNWVCYIAYGCGFAMGNLIGISLEEKLAFGKLVVRIIVGTGADKLIQRLRLKGFGVTSMEARGAQGRVKVVYLVIERGDLETVTDTLQRTNPKAFYTVEDTRMVKKGIFPEKKNFLERQFDKPPRFIRVMKLYWRSMLNRK
jgi:uncharacterized protein YebE (UPF0316 family)